MIDFPRNSFFFKNSLIWTLSGFSLIPLIAVLLTPCNTTWNPLLFSGFFWLPIFPLILSLSQPSGKSDPLLTSVCLLTVGMGLLDWLDAQNSFLLKAYLNIPGFLHLLNALFYLSIVMILFSCSRLKRMRSVIPVIAGVCVLFCLYMILYPESLFPNLPDILKTPQTEIPALLAILISSFFFPAIYRYSGEPMTRGIIAAVIPLFFTQLSATASALHFPGEERMIPYTRLMVYVLFLVGFLFQFILKSHLKENNFVRSNTDGENTAGKHREFNAVLRCITEGVIITDKDGKPVEMNAAMAQLLRLDKTGKVFDPSIELADVIELYERDGEKLTNDDLPMIKAVRKGKTILHSPVQLRREGEKIDLLANAKPIENENGMILGSVTSFRDITEIQKLLRVKNEFINTISHELRTPLSSIVGYLDLVREGDVGEINSEQKSFLDTAFQNTLHLKNLINDLLDIEQIESGTLTLIKEPCLLSEIMEEVVAMFIAKASEKGLTFISDIQEQVKIIGDRNRLSQIVYNLLTNAIKYTKEGSVEVKLYTENRKAFISIKDTGIGMSSQELEVLFEHFTRSTERYVQEAGGTGLGLPIIRALVELHSGSLEVESRKGIGSEFIVALPLSNN